MSTINALKQVFFLSLFYQKFHQKCYDGCGGVNNKLLHFRIIKKWF